jgi:trehalose 6-phosphate phosphatase
LFPGLTLPIAGQHGCERRDAEGTIHLHAPVKATQARLRKMLQKLAQRHPRLILEDKGASLALHYRSTPQLASHVHRTLRRSLRDDDGYRLQPGKMLLEVRPEGSDKGTAIKDFMAEPPFAGRLPVFVGDDQTDERGFAAVEKLYGWTVKVGPGQTVARFRLGQPAAVKRWLLAPITYAPHADPIDVR